MNYDYGNQVLGFQRIPPNHITTLYSFLTGLLLLMITSHIQEFCKFCEESVYKAIEVIKK